MTRGALSVALALVALAGCKDDPPPPTPLDCSGLADLGVAGEVVHETATVTWTNTGRGSETEELLVSIPPDLESLTLVVETGESYTAIGTLRQEGVSYLDGRADPFGETAPYFHTLGQAGAVALPANEDSAIGPGCALVQGISDESLGGRTGTLHFVTRRRAAGGTLHLSLVRVGATELGEVTMDEIGTEVAAVFTEAGIDTDIELVDVDGPAFVEAEGVAAGVVRSSYRPADPLRIVVYLIQAFSDEPFTLGFAAGIPGPNGVTGTVSSGVLISYDAHIDDEGFILPTMLAETIAHEVGHQVGLFHTTEAEGSEFDAIGDTLECPRRMFDADGDGELTAEECETAGGDNLMFWLSALEFSQRELSPTQRRLLELSPVTR